MNLGLQLQRNMTSCQGLVPKDLKPNHLAVWIIPSLRKNVGFELLPFISSLQGYAPVVFFFLTIFFYSIETEELHLSEVLLQLACD